MTRRGWLTLLLGAATYVVAWLFGAKALYPVATGLVLAPLGALAWVWLAAGPMQLRRRAGKGALLEGEDVWVSLDVQPESRTPAAGIAITETIARFGEQVTTLSRAGGGYRGTYVLERVPRGRYIVEEARATIDDPFGLARLDVDLDARGSLLVYPRLVLLDRLFSEGGAHAQDGRRLLLRRPSGFDLHSVREYEQGESLRKVHWKTTARRGQLMVKELEDAPRDEIAVILDADASAVVEDSFDVQVRAAGSILRAHASHARRAVLAVNSAARPSMRVTSLDGDWLAALGVLAEAEPDGTRPVVELLGTRERTGVAGSRDGRDHRAPLRRADDQARAAGARGPGRQHRLGRQRQLRRPADEGGAGAASAPGRRRRRRGPPPRRLPHRRSRCCSGPTERPCLGRSPSRHSRPR